MRISARNLSFGYEGNPVFENLNLDLGRNEDGRPTVILGPSGCGKTTLLKLLSGLLKPDSGTVETEAAGRTAFMFQESRLLPWLTIIENVALPLEKELGRPEARMRARRFLSEVFLTEKENAFPNELSGGQAQRASMARAFAWPTRALFLDEPFQSLDIPLRLELMDAFLSLAAGESRPGEGRLILAVTHEVREAIYMGGRIVVLGKAGRGTVMDGRIDLGREERGYGSGPAAELEGELIDCLKAASA